MENKTYNLRYLPLFEQDLLEAVSYITDVLKNPQAADRLIDDVEQAILERLSNPESFETYRSAKKKTISILSDLCTELCCLLCSH